MDPPAARPAHPPSAEFRRYMHRYSALGEVKVIPRLGD